MHGTSWIPSSVLAVVLGEAVADSKRSPPQAAGLFKTIQTDSTVRPQSFRYDAVGCSGGSPPQ
jgi:hypothetical protein